MDKEEKPSDASVFVPETRTITIGEKEFVVSKFTLEQWIKVARELTAFASSIFIAIRKERPDTSIAELKKIKVEEILPYVWTELHRVVPVLAMAIDEKSEWLKKQDDMEGISALFKAICELNNFKVIFANFTGAFQTLVAQWKEAEAGAKKAETKVDSE